MACVVPKNLPADTIVSHKDMAQMFWRCHLDRLAFTSGHDPSYSHPDLTDECLAVASTNSNATAIAHLVLYARTMAHLELLDLWSQCRREREQRLAAGPGNHSVTRLGSHPSQISMSSDEQLFPHL